MINFIWVYTMGQCITHYNYINISNWFIIFIIMNYSLLLKLNNIIIIIILLINEL